MRISDANRQDAADTAEFGEIAAAAAHYTVANLPITGADSMAVNITANTTTHGAAAGNLCGCFAASMRPFGERA